MRITFLALTLLCAGALGHYRNYTTLTLRKNAGALSLKSELKNSELEQQFTGAGQGDAKAFREPVFQYLQERFKMRTAEGPCQIHQRPDNIDRDPEHTFIVTSYDVSCPGQSEAYDFTYDLFFDKDPSHVGVLVVEQNARDAAINLFSEKARDYRFDGKQRDLAFWSFVKEGVFHIWIGIDHILFLLVLLLAAPLIFRAGRFEPVGSFRAMLSDVLKTVTAFTISHSITLIIASLELFLPPARIIETIIAISIAVAAWNNLRPFLPNRSWLIAFLFGFIHGFGFANVLQDLVAERASFASILFGFNLGVELGQLAIVAVALPILYLLHRGRHYLTIVKVGSSFAIVIALLWAIERGFALSFMPF